MKLKKIKFVIIALSIAIISISNFGINKPNEVSKLNVDSLFKTALADPEGIPGDLCMHGLPSYCVFLDEDLWPIYIVDPGDWI